MRKIIAALLVIFTLAIAADAWAQSPAAVAKLATPQAAAAAMGAAPLTPAEAQAVLEVLNDPVKRAAFAARIELFSKALKAAAPPPPAAVPLAPGSVGAQVVAQVAQSATWLSSLTSQVAELDKLLGNLPVVWRFLTRTAADPDLRDQALHAFGGLALFLLGAVAVEWAAGRGLRRPVAALARRAEAASVGAARMPAQPGQAVPNTAAISAAESAKAAPSGLMQAGFTRTVFTGTDFAGNGDADTGDADTGDAQAGGAETGSAEADAAAPVAKNTAPHAEEKPDNAPAPRLDRLLHTLRRLAFVIPRVVLDLLPIGLFLALSSALYAFARQETQDVLDLAIRTYITARLVLVAAGALLSPDYPALRPLQLGTRAARYLRRWARRLVALAAFGALTIGIGDLYDMPAMAREALIKLFSLAGHIMLFIMVLQLRRPVARRLRAGAVSNPTMERVRDFLAAYWHWPALFLIVSTWVVWAARLRHGLERAGMLGLWSIGVLIAYRLATTLVVGGLERLLAPSAPAGRAQNYGPHRYLGLIRRLLNTMLLTMTMLALLQIWGVQALAWFQSGKLGGQLATAGGTVLIVGLVCLAIWEGMNLNLENQLDHLMQAAQGLRAARLRTLLPILRTSLLVTLLAAFSLTTLSEIGVNIAPLLAGAGILGVAIGFGSQKLVQDFITGIFLLLENAMQVGDWVSVAGFSGTVEALSIRTLKLRGSDGAVHVIPFSAVTTVSNSHRGIGIASISVTIDASQDTDHVSTVLAEIAQDMHAERRFADMMHGGFQLFGVDRLEAGTATITGQISCTDSGRLPVQREFNRRLNIRLRQLGLRTMAPVQTTTSLAPSAVSPS